MGAYYDTIAEQYQKSSLLPVRRYVEQYTYLNLLGDLSGKSILDLGCGEGSYTRKLKQLGATRVVGVDISPKMLSLAREKEHREPLGIEYILSDVTSLGSIGSFSLVVASYLLNHAQTKEQLLKMCRTILANLESGGSFLSISGNISQPPSSYPICEKYGITKSISSPLQEGTPITITFKVDGQKFSLINYYLSLSTYESVFQSVGFKEIRWHPPRVSPEGLQKFGQDFWQDFIDNQLIVGIELIASKEKSL